MVGPAFAISALTAAATLMPFPAGAEGLLVDEGVNPMVIPAMAEMSDYHLYWMEFTRNALLSGSIAAGIPYMLYKVDQSRDSTHRRGYGA